MRKTGTSRPRPQRIRTQGKREEGIHERIHFVQTKEEKHQRDTRTPPILSPQETKEFLALQLTEQEEKEELKDDKEDF